MYYTDTVTIPNYLCDCHDRLTMWGLARLLQESAGHHAETASMGFRQLIERGKAWVLCRMYFVVDRLPSEGETVTVRTWTRGTDGLFAFREFELIDAQGVAVSCSTYWVIIDFSSRKALRIHDYWGAVEIHPDCATDRQRLDRLRLPRDAAQPVAAARFAVRPSMLDHTFHVNNAEYIKWVFDHLPQPPSPSGLNPALDRDALPSGRPFRFAIEFLTETKPDEQVAIDIIQSPAEPGATYFSIANPRATAVLAAVMNR